MVGGSLSLYPTPLLWNSSVSNLSGLHDHSGHFFLGGNWLSFVQYTDPCGLGLQSSTSGLLLPPKHVPKLLPLLGLLTTSLRPRFEEFDKVYSIYAVSFGC